MIKMLRVSTNRILFVNEGKRKWSYGPSCSMVFSIKYIPRSTRSSSLVTLARPSTSSSLRITDRAFQYASTRLWNQRPAPLRQPRTNLSNSASPSCMSEQWKWRWWRLFWYRSMDGYSEADGCGNSKILRQMRSGKKK